MYAHPHFLLSREHLAALDSGERLGDSELDHHVGVLLALVRTDVLPSLGALASDGLLRGGLAHAARLAAGLTVQCLVVHYYPHETPAAFFLTPKA